MDYAPLSNEVYRWPEFKALCERLGIEWNLPTVKLEIILSGPDLPVRIIHEYRGKDQPPLAEEVKDGKVETTSLHNEKFRTFRPAHVVSGG